MQPDLIETQQVSNQLQILLYSYNQSNHYIISTNVKMAYLTTFTLILMYMNYGIGAPTCDDPPETYDIVQFPFNESLNNVDKTIQVPPNIFFLGRDELGKWEVSDDLKRIIFTSDEGVVEAKIIPSSSRLQPDLIFIESGLNDRRIIESPNSLLKIQVNHDYQHQLGPTAVELYEPHMHFPKQTWGNCYSRSTLEFKIRHQYGNLNELGMLAFVYMASNIQHLKEQDRPLYMRWANGSVKLELNRYNRHNDKPFCVAIELLDITGKRSSRSTPLCLDPTDESAAYISGEGAPGQSGCSLTGDARSQNSTVWILTVLLLSFIRLRTNETQTKYRIFRH